MYTDNDLLLISGIQHFAFCPRQWALIHIEQQWQENLLTFGGRELHERVDDPFFTEARGTVLVTRSLPILSRRLGLYGVADVVEFYQSDEGVQLRGRKGLWRPHPVEYKYGEPKIDERDMVQLCAQAFCLEEMFNTSVTEGDIFYGRIRRRQKVEFDEPLRQRVIELSREMHRLFEEGITPLPEQTKACRSCSLVEICLPHTGKRRSVRRYLDDALRESK
ncbi:MAG: CRISPR-associated protein Cas4 [Firmicutes bacterium]|nr:CRISPR-associated protein Cas4 [Bacillota bacterium]